MNTVDEIVDAILEETPHAALSAETINTLHGCTESHPFGRGKPEVERAREACCAVADRNVDGVLKDKLECRFLFLFNNTQ